MISQKTKKKFYMFSMFFLLLEQSLPELAQQFWSDSGFRQKSSAQAVAALIEQFWRISLFVTDDVCDV